MSTRPARTGIAALFLLSFALAACQSEQDPAAETVTTGGGSAASVTQTPPSAPTEVVVGAVAGGVIGGRIGRSLNEQDQRQAAVATAAALRDADQGRPASAVAWTSSSGSGASGQATVVNKPQSSTPSVECYDVREVAITPGGGEIEQTTRYCKAEQGWVVA